MRRSAAPSFRADTKRRCFIPATFHDGSNKYRANSYSSNSNPSTITSKANSKVSDSVTSEMKFQLLKQSKASGFRSNEDILNIILNDDSLNTNIINNEMEKTTSNQNLVAKPQHLQSLESCDSSSLTMDESGNKLSNCIFCVKNVEVASLFSVLWCKRSGRKHKKWEGDGLLVVKNRSAVLKDLTGKVLEKGLGYKLEDVESLENGSKFFIGGKECEIQYKISDEDINCGKYCRCSNLEEYTIRSPVKQNFKSYKFSKKFCLPMSLNLKNQDGIDSSILEENSNLLPSRLEHQTSEMKFQLLKQSNASGFRSNEDILNILNDDSLNTNNASNEIEKTTMRNQNLVTKPQNPQSLESCDPSLTLVTTFGSGNKLSNCIFCVKNTEVASLFSVLWCKRSGKKHKSWEGDGLLLVKNQSAVLKDLTGKVLEKGLGYKLKEIESLEDGRKFFIGGKECEMQYKISEEDINCGKYCKCSNLEEHTQLRSPVKQDFKNYKFSKKFHLPISLNLKGQNGVDSSILNENCLLLPSPTLDHQAIHNKGGLPVIDVYVDSFITKQLRSHQKEGISFMYKCIMGFQHEFGQGVILADEMGLGKSLQCIALIWTLYKKGPYGGFPVLQKVIIITPSSLVTNWQNEFHKWLGKTRLPIFAVNKKNGVKDFMKSPKVVLIISYEMFLRSSQLLSSTAFDMVICDEGHRIKNLKIKISNVVNCLSTAKRILLTGTPIQNDLAEFFSIVDFVNPGALGSIQYFRKNFEKPITQSRNQECSELEKEYGESQSDKLSNMTKMFMLRRTQEVIKQYLPPKTETIIFCRTSEMQNNLYRHLLKSREVLDILSSETFDTSVPLVCISVLRKLCNHPSLLYRAKMIEDTSDNSMLDYMGLAFPANYEVLPADSGKMKVLESMLESLFSHNVKKEKVVLVSIFTKTLDILEVLCKLKNYEYLRLDGSTNLSSRQEIVDIFNCSYTKYSVFLLSSKAGGVGFNLVGASRIILYDIDWNPANDLQAMSRIWRDGQKHDVYVYRLLTTGTIEEKIFQRQLSKQCLSDSVLDANSTGKLRFSKEELMDLFTFHENTRCVTHDLINCNCLSLEYILNIDEVINTENNFKDQVKNAGMAELMNWNHVCGPISNENCSDSCLIHGGNDITFLFQNTVNAGKKTE